MTTEADALALLRAVAARAEAARRLEAGGTQALLRSIVDATVSLFQAEASSIALYDAATDRLVFRVAAGEQGQGVVGVSIPTSQGIAGFVYSTGQSLAISDVRQDPRFGRDVAESTGYVPRSLIAVPLVDDHGTIGVLEVLDKRDSATFSLRDVELAGVFARQAAIAISASRVERDVANLLSSAAATLLDGSAEGVDVDEIVARATAGLDGEDESRLWQLADLVARVRRADPEQLELVSELLAALARHAERATRRGRRGA
jgi:GAF domain-containing protein